MSLLVVVVVVAAMHCTHFWTFVYIARREKDKKE